MFRYFSIYFCCFKNYLKKKTTLNLKARARNKKEYIQYEILDHNLQTTALIKYFCLENEPPNIVCWAGGILIMLFWSWWTRNLIWKPDRLTIWSVHWRKNTSTPKICNHFSFSSFDRLYSISLQIWFCLYSIWTDWLITWSWYAQMYHGVHTRKATTK